MENGIETLQLNDEILKILKENKINNIEQLTDKTRTQLKAIGLFGYQISEIELRLQLEGFDLKGNR